MGVVLVLSLRIPVIVLTALVFSGLAGCLGEGSQKDADVDLPETDKVINPGLTGEDLEREIETAFEITKDSEVPAPAWTVGEYWSFMVSFGGEWGTDEFDFDAVVYEDSGSEYLVATENAEVAKFDAMSDFPLLGAFAKGTLDTTNGGIPLSLYKWPLKDGLSWQAEYDPDLDGVTATYTFHAAFEPAISTPIGELPGYTIHGLDATDRIVFSWDYVPALHWANHIFFYNPNNLEEYNLHIMVMDHGFNWAGTLLVETSEAVVETERFMSVMPPPSDPSGLPVFTFDVAEGYSSLGGFWFSFACDGVGETLLVAPSGEQYEAQIVHAGTPTAPPPDPADPFTAFQDCGAAFGFGVEIPAEVGQWKVAMAYAGMAGGGLYLYGFVEEAIPMGDATTAAAA